MGAGMSGEWCIGIMQKVPHGSRKVHSGWERHMWDSMCWKECIGLLSILFLPLSFLRRQASDCYCVGEEVRDCEMVAKLSQNFENEDPTAAIAVQPQQNFGAATTSLNIIVSGVMASRI